MKDKHMEIFLISIFYCFVGASILLLYNSSARKEEVSELREKVELLTNDATRLNLRVNSLEGSMDLTAKLMSDLTDTCTDTNDSIRKVVVSLQEQVANHTELFELMEKRRGFERERKFDPGTN